MRLLIDECLPRPIKRLFGEHECRTVQEMGWSGKSNGELLSLAEVRFDALITVDQGVQYEQNLVNRRIAVLVFVARSNNIEDLAPLIPNACAALSSLQPGRVVRVRG
jgi:hypothetical protein